MVSGEANTNLPLKYSQSIPINTCVIIILNNMTKCEECGNSTDDMYLVDWKYLCFSCAEYATDEEMIINVEM